MSPFRFGQKVCLKPEAVRDFILEGYIPSDFNPNTIGQLDVPIKGLSSYRWIFCYDQGKRVGVDEHEIDPVRVFAPSN